jgi:hypothetical protein
MKKIIALFSIFTLFTACQKDVEFNNPALQGSLNNIFWKGSSKLVSKTASGAITIYGRGQSGDVTLNINSQNVGTYELGTTNQSNRASVLQSGNIAGDYTTGLNKNPAQKITLNSSGSGYSSASTQSISTIGGSGSGLKVNITVNASGGITAVEIATSGLDYMPGDIVTIVGGNQNATFVVNTVQNSNGKIRITENTGTTISGTFQFVAYDNTTKKTVVCRDGVFYKLPITAATN